jgi:hypothetical protein
LARLGLADFGEKKGILLGIAIRPLSGLQHSICRQHRLAE